MNIQSKRDENNERRYKTMKNKKGQAAMEFLMTYGWAILAAIIAIGVLAAFGVFSPGKLTPFATNGNFICGNLHDGKPDTSFSTDLERQIVDLQNHFSLEEVFFEDSKFLISLESDNKLSALKCTVEYSICEALTESADVCIKVETELPINLDEWRFWYDGI